MATCATARSINQSAKASRSAVCVLKVRVLRWSAPSGAEMRQQATTVRSWTSKPAHWVKTTFILHLVTVQRLAGYLGRENFPCVLLGHAEYHSAVCRRVSRSVSYSGSWHY